MGSELKRKLAFTLALICTLGGDALLAGDAQERAPVPVQASIGKIIGARVGEFAGDLRSLPQTPPPRAEVMPEPLEVPPHPEKFAQQPEATVPEASIAYAPNMPSPSHNFKGLDFMTWGAGAPPDPVGDVGPSHYVQAGNVSMGIFTKTGTLLAATTLNTLWSGAGTGTPCDNSHHGDPTVVYDSLADRWIVADLAFTGNGTSPPYYLCLSVSRTGDPVGGGWWFHAVRADDAAHPWFPDYPKMALWPDGIYMTANMFAAAATYQEVRVWAFNRSDLEAGVSVRTVVADLGTTSYFSLLPSNLHGIPPPAGRPNLVVGEDRAVFAFDVFKFHVDYTGAGSSFTGPTLVSQTSYSAPQNTNPSAANALDTVGGDALKMQAQYRNINASESLWVQHSIRLGASAPNGIQWAQIDVTGGTISTTPVQQQNYGNVGGDAVYRFMGSLAVDRAGDMALGYSGSKAGLNPEILYSGRLASDSPGTLAQGEASLVNGTGSQSGNCGPGTCTRWGDYSAMTADPLDDCTFWYTNEYYETTGLNWQTRIGSFVFPGCAPRSPGEPYPVFLGKSGGNLVLTWTALPSGCGAQDYAVYKGSLTSLPAYDHAPVACSTLGAPAYAMPMPGDARAYFIVTSQTAFDEGSYGRNRSSVERPAAAAACRSIQTLGSCP